jgi:hypothetical protein
MLKIYGTHAKRKGIGKMVINLHQKYITIKIEKLLGILKRKKKLRRHTMKPKPNTISLKTENQ